MAPHRMNLLPRDIWLRLERRQIRGEQLRAKAPFPGQTERLLCAVDLVGTRHVLLEIDDHHNDYQPGTPRGLFVTNRQLEWPGEGLRRYLDFTCASRSQEIALDLLGPEFAYALQLHKSIPDAVDSVISRWEKFWTAIPSKPLDRASISGLFGELWFINRIGIDQEHLIRAIECWSGPSKDRHDFALRGLSVEVKTSASSRGHIHRINGLEQLERPASGELILFSCLINEKGQKGLSLVDLVEKILSSLSGNLGAYDKFLELLIQYGYLPHHKDEFEKIRFEITQERMFEVDEDFPRIVTSDLPQLHLGIEKVEYVVNLNGVSSSQLTFADIRSHL